METVRNSILFQSLAAKHRNVEVWPLESAQGDWQYYGIVSNDDGAVRVLAYLRMMGNQFESRTYEDPGDDMCLPATGTQFPDFKNFKISDSPAIDLHAAAPQKAI